jgi:hypothetical protein
MGLDGAKNCSALPGNAKRFVLLLEIKSYVPLGPMTNFSPSLFDYF